MNYFQKIFFFSTLSFLFSCSNNIPPRNEVVVHELADPAMMNPINATDAVSNYICSHIFQKLIDFDFKVPGKIVGVLAEDRPQIEKTSDGKMILTFKIRNEAKWDDDSPVTAKDVEFTLKTIKCPLVNDQNARPYFDFISDFKYFENDTKKFSVICSKIYFLAEPSFSDVPIYPEYLYDPKGLLKKIPLREIADEKYSADTSMKEFADDFNSEKRMRDKNFISGSGPYKFFEWKTNDHITLIKKENWWGNSVEHQNCFFEAYPEKLIYRFIKDQTTALVALKAENLDVMRSIKNKDFKELPNSEKFEKNFSTFTPMQYAYAFIGINLKNKIFADKLTRQALAHLVNVDKMIETLKYGQAERVIGPIHPSKKSYYNSSVKPYEYNIEEAKKLLEQSGWKNSNGDETLDKIIDGKRTEFVADIYFNSESDERKSIALMLQEEAKKVGIKINLVGRDYVSYIGTCTKHDFDLMIWLWITGPNPDDLKPSFHTEAANNGGSNFQSFSNAEADSLMDAIRIELDENKRCVMYKRLQEIFHEELPMIFLWAPSERIAISKRFENAYVSSIRPGYWEQSFKVKK